MAADKLTREEYLNELSVYDKVHYKHPDRNKNARLVSGEDDDVDTDGSDYDTDTKTMSVAGNNKKSRAGLLQKGWKRTSVTKNALSQSAGVPMGSDKEGSKVNFSRKDIHISEQQLEESKKSKRADFSMHPHKEQLKKLHDLVHGKTGLQGNDNYNEQQKVYSHADSNGYLSDAIRVGQRKDKIMFEGVEQLDEASVSRKHFKEVASNIAAIKDPEEKQKMADWHAGIYAKANPRFNHSIWHNACGTKG
jgi:hypothetical protein